MKKRIVMSLLLGLSIFMLASCGEVSDVTEEDEEIEEEQDEEEDEDEEPGDDEQDPEAEPVEEALGTVYAISKYSSSENIYLFDEDGNPASSITRTELAKGVNDDFKEYIETTDGIAKSSLMAYGDGFFFFEDVIQDESTEKYMNRIYAKRADDSVVYIIWYESTDLSITAIDYYDGKLYIDHTEGYDENSRVKGYDESVFVYAPDRDAFEDVNNDIEDMLDVINKNGVYPRASRINSTSQSSCYSRTVDETGYLLLYSQDQGYQIINKKGKVQNIKLPEDASFVEYYDAGHVFYLEWDDSYSKATACFYNINTEENTAITDGRYPISTLGRYGDKYYFSIDRSDDYGLTHNYIYEFDAEDEMTNLLYDVEKTPGTTIIPGTQTFTIAGDNIYFLGVDNGDETWMRFSLTDGSSTVYNTGVVEKHLDLFDIGSIGYMSNTGACPDCGTPIEMNYCEYLEIDDSLSKYADDINEYLRTAAENAVVIEDGVLGEGETCEDHQEHPSWYQITDEISVASAEIIDDRYLAVNMSGYWYAGGAHGMPSRFQYLFDLETGEVKNLTDFYEGSEEEFKELIAEKTKEDYLSYEYYGNPYFAMDENEAYEEALGYVSLTAASADFTQDGIYYYYPPYMMGPYASGYIDVFVSYEDLLGRPTLAE